MVVNRGDVYLIALDPTIGSEVNKTRPGVVISPDELNHYARTVIVAPMTTKGRLYPTRVPCRFEGKSGLILLDQVRTVDKTRLKRKLGQLSRPSMQAALQILVEMFTADPAK